MAKRYSSTALISMASQVSGIVDDPARAPSMVEGLFQGKPPLESLKSAAVSGLNHQRADHARTMAKQATHTQTPAPAVQPQVPVPSAGTAPSGG